MWNHPHHHRLELLLHRKIALSAATSTPIPTNPSAPGLPVPLTPYPPRTPPSTRPPTRPSGAGPLSRRPHHRAGRLAPVPTRPLTHAFPAGAVRDSPLARLRSQGETLPTPPPRRLRGATKRPRFQPTPHAPRLTCPATPSNRSLGACSGPVAKAGAKAPAVPSTGLSGSLPSTFPKLLGLPQPQAKQ